MQPLTLIFPSNFLSLNANAYNSKIFPSYASLIWISNFKLTFGVSHASPINLPLSMIYAVYQGTLTCYNEKKNYIPMIPKQFFFFFRFPNNSILSTSQKIHLLLQFLWSDSDLHHFILSLSNLLIDWRFRRQPSQTFWLAFGGNGKRINDSDGEDNSSKRKTRTVKGLLSIIESSLLF
jgi:hypothetical protein